jgi:NADH-quinone oxidoreductase subunit L
MNILFPLIIPVTGALIILLPFSDKARKWTAFIFSFITAVSVLWLYKGYLSGEALYYKKTMPFSMDFYFSADVFSMIIASMSAVTGMLIVLYSTAYMKSRAGISEFYFFILIFISAMMGIVFSRNCVWLYVFWEIAAVCSWRLIGYNRLLSHVRAANKAFLITFGAAAFMLVGFVCIFLRFGTFNMDELAGNTIPLYMFALIFTGMLAKSAIFPLHTWLPDAGVAPSPVTAFLHAAVLVKIGVYAFVRFFYYVFDMGSGAIYWVSFLAILSAIIAGSVALVEKDVKRILAYSTISQISFIMFGLGLFSKTAFAGVLIYIIAHAIGKAGLFLCAGIIEQQTGERNITKVSGLINNMPLTFLAFIFCSLSIMGMPPFIGFFGKLYIILGSAGNGGVFLTFLAIIASILTLLYIIRLVRYLFFGSSSHLAAKDGSFVMVSTVLVFAFLSLFGGFLVFFAGTLMPGIFLNMPVFK